MSNALNNVNVIVDGEPIAVQPNSVKYNDGDGEVTLRSQTTGSTVEVVRSVNAETKIGMAGFILLSTDENAALLRKWRRDENAHTVELSQDGTDFQRAFRNMRISNNPDVETGHDSSFDVEFQGERAA